MKRLAFLLALTFFFVGCSQQRATQQANKQYPFTPIEVSSPTATPAQRNEAISPEGKIFEPLTPDSNYFDVVKLLGTPTDEVNISRGKGSKYPAFLGCYFQNNTCIAFANIRSQEEGFKSNYNYLGALKIYPPEILHAAKKENLDVLEIFRGMLQEKLKDIDKETDRGIKQKK